MKKIKIFSCMFLIVMMCLSIMMPSILAVNVNLDYGDIDGDGVITTADAIKVLRYVKGKEGLSTEQLKLADVDGNKKIEIDDAYLIYYKSICVISGLPINMMGDVDEDGKVTSGDALIVYKASVGLQELNYFQRKLADVNGDGEVTSRDALLIMNKSIESLKYFPTEVMYGDVDDDGVITSNDAILVLRYSEGKEDFSEEQKAIADVNGDSKINRKDAMNILRKTTDSNYKFAMEQ